MISRSMLTTRVAVSKLLPWLSPFGGSPPSFEGLLSVISITSSRELKSDLQDMKSYLSDSIPGDSLYSLLLYNIHLNNV